MTKGSSKEECNEIIGAIERAHKGKSWFLKAYIDSDDHGLCVAVKVNRNDPTRENVDKAINGVKVVTYLIG